MGLKNLSYSLLSIALATCLGMILAGCQQAPSEDISANNLAPSSWVASRDMNRYAMNKVVCDPLGEGNPVPPPPTNGIAANLAYLAPTQSPFSKSSDYMTKGTQSSQQLFFSDLFVPTRLFTEGFSTQTSQIIKNDVGDKLIEYFGLHFRTQLFLVGDDQTDGNYELAVLSDDGTTVKIVSGDQSQLLINNEGDHPTRLGCSATSVALSHTQGLNLDITYYQGPRYHISMVMLWRPAQAKTLGKDPSCGLTGNDTFFDFNNKSAPQKAYKDLLARGWRPIPAGNYFLPASEDINPCTPGSPLTMADIELGAVTGTSAQVSWSTNRVSTSQALVVNTASGDQFLTASDQTLTTSHSLMINGLTPGATYSVQVLSVAEDGARTIGDPITVVTPQ